MEYTGWDWPDENTIPQILFSVGGGLSLVLLIEILHQLLRFTGSRVPSVAELPWAYIISYTITIPFIGGILYGAHYLSGRPFPAQRNHRILKWSLSGMVIWLAINTLTMISFGISSLWPAVGWVRGALAWGCAFGLLIGIIEAQSISNAIEKEQAAMRAESLKEKQDTIDYLSSMLRHEVLNSASIIRGYGEVLQEEIPESESHWQYTQPIVNQSEGIVSFVKESREMMESVSHDPDLRPIDLLELLQTEAKRAAEIKPQAEVTVDVPDDVHVWGDGMLCRVFGNLLSNAVENTEQEPIRVTVSANAGPESVTVSVVDNGPGIDKEMHETLFDRPTESGSDHGFGLYIVSQLCERYGGDVSLHETGPEGTAFRVTLQRAHPDSEVTTESPLKEEAEPTQSP